ncbi:MAG: LysR family transcriptional regulator [Spongiibacteraceae bacterium]|nr:LysR family transcriptional regulator [Spongiibacteraceae bacterium]
MRFTLRQIEVFLEVARTENISRAAEALAMSQSAASSALGDLERHFDVQLFDRIGKRLQLNELGRMLWPRAQLLLEQAHDLELALRQHREVGEVKIGATLTIGNYVAVDLMATFMNQEPGARVTLDVGNTETIADKVAHFELDLGLLEGEVRHPDLEMTPWRDDELVVFCAPDHPLANKGVLTDEDLTSATWVLREHGSGTRQTFDRALHGLHHRLNVLLELQHTEAIKRTVEAGLGISCLSRVTVEDAFRRGTLVPLSVPHRNFRRQFYFVLHRHKFRTAGIQRWLDLCRESAAQDTAVR